MSWDVSLAAGQTPAFPDLCCSCLAPSPDERLKLSQRRGRWIDLLVPWLLLTRRPARCEVPICAPCRSRHRRQRALQLVAGVALVAAAFVLVMPWLKSLDLPRVVERLAMIGVIVVAGLPFFYWCVMMPLAADLTVCKAHVEYEFANVRYAQAFLAANPDGWSDDLDIMAELDALEREMLALADDDDDDEGERA